MTEMAKRLVFLRKEHRLTQKQAAQELGISQALLSHYERGIRECGLTFLARAADFYGVSCDYLLGRTMQPRPDSADQASVPIPQRTSGLSASMAKALVQNASAVVLDLADQTKSAEVVTLCAHQLYLAIYQLFGSFYHASPSPEGQLTLPRAQFPTAVETQRMLGGMKLRNLLLHESWPQHKSRPVSLEPLPRLTYDELRSRYGNSATALFNVLSEADSLCMRQFARR